jgi:hypothetical protein
MTARRGGPKKKPKSVAFPFFPELLGTFETLERHLLVCWQVPASELHCIPWKLHRHIAERCLPTTLPRPSSLFAATRNLAPLP